MLELKKGNIRLEALLDLDGLRYFLLKALPEVNVSSKTANENYFRDVFIGVLDLIVNELDGFPTLDACEDLTTSMLRVVLLTDVKE
jgi:hypothetical protein